MSKRVTINEAKEAALYAAISIVITDYRIMKHRTCIFTNKEDTEVSRLVDAIWRKQAEILGVEG